MQIANSYTGITGNTSLDEAGYRKYGDYDFWAVKANNGTNNDHSFEWKKVGVFKSDANTILTNINSSIQIHVRRHPPYSSRVGKRINDAYIIC